jgi:ATP-dependent Clp protease ATP-binding subunit ClpA
VNGYNFTERVRKVLAMSREEAVRLRHEYVGTEHILLGVIREGEGVAATVLQNLSVELDDVQHRIEETVKRGTAGQTTGPDLPYTSRAKKVLELSMSEARELNHSYVGTEHLLLGLIREEKGIAAQALNDFGVTLDAARAETLRILGTEMPQANSLTATPEHRSKPRTPVRIDPTTASAVAGIPVYAARLGSVITAARDVALRQKSAQITSAHAAIALLEHGEGAANAALAYFDFSPAEALAALYQLAPTGAKEVGPEDVVTMTSELMTVLQSLDARQAPGPAFAPGTQHLLLSILHTSPDVAAVFAEQSLTEENIRDKIIHISG